MTNQNFSAFKMGKEVFTVTGYDTQAFHMHWTQEKGGKVPSHFHEHMDEVFRIRKGEILFVVNGEKIHKKAGEEFLVPRGTVHSVANAGDSTVEVDVSYMPCADVHKMFILIDRLEKEQASPMKNMLRYMYVQARLGWKPFSTPSPLFINNIMRSLIGLIGKLSGWDTYVNRFRDLK